MQTCTRWWKDRTLLYLNSREFSYNNVSQRSPLWRWRVFPWLKTVATCNGPFGTKKKRPCRAFTLLEVILAMAILAGALASLGEVVRLSGENANYARDHSQAQLLAASKLAEITAGAEELTNVAPTRFDIDSDPPWLYSIQWEATDEEDLIAVRVTVEQELSSKLQPVRFSLTRWMPDPGAVIEEEAASASDSETASGEEGR